MKETVFMKGEPVSAGIAIGKVLLYGAAETEQQEAFFPAGQEEQKLQEWKAAFDAAGAELQALVSKLTEEGSSEAKIFSAHMEVLEDEELAECVHDAICFSHKEPACAVREAFGEFIDLLSMADDPLIAGRTADLKDVRNRLLRLLGDSSGASLAELSEPVIVVARELLPSDTATMDKSKVLGIVTEQGGSTSHSAIIARGYGIPAVLGVNNIMAQAENGQELIADGETGQLILSPNDEQRQEYLEKQDRFNLYKILLEKYYDTEGRTVDGERVEVGLNIGSEKDVDGLAQTDYIGLFRTEFLYMQAQTMPSEEEQFAAYRTVLENAAGKPVTLRTLDIGGDKSLPYLVLEKEENPFLGVRALRLCLKEKELFVTQLRAALRASVYGKLWIMLPMVGSLEDVRRAKAVVEEVKEQLKNEGKAFDPDFKLGIMIEIPAAALIADLLAKEVDFASIGSNDLTQYTCAVDRMNSNLSDYYQSLAPSVLRLIAMSVSAFNKAGKPISICGELGGDTRATEILVGLGMRKLSMNNSGIAGVKHALSKLDIESAQQLAQQVLNMSTQQEVLEAVKAYKKARE